MDVVRIFLVGRHAVRSEQLPLHHLRKAEDRVKGRAQLMAHRCEKPRLGQIGAFGPAARLVRTELGLFELGDERILLLLKRDVALGRRMQALDDDKEIADDANRDRRRGQRVPLQAGGVKNDDADDHRQHAGHERGRNGRGQQRHHRRNEQHDQRGESLRVRLGRLKQGEDEIGPGGAAKAGRQDELAPPCAGGLLAVGAVEKSDRQSVDERDRADDEGRPGGERARADPGKGCCAESERHQSQHRRGAAVDLGEEPHHRGRMARNCVGADNGAPRAPDEGGHPPAARRRTRLAPAPGYALRPQLTHNRPTRTATRACDYAVQILNEPLTAGTSAQGFLPGT